MKKTVLANLIRFSLMVLTMPLLQAAQEYPIYRMKTPPVIDGLADDPEWQTKPEGRGFKNVFGTRQYSTDRLTTFKMGWDNEFLYLLVKSQEPAPEKIKAFYSYRDGFACDDSIELFLQPAQSSKFLQIVMNAAGAYIARWEAAETDADNCENLRTAAKIGKDNWVLEARIPYQAIGITAEHLSGVKFNVTRNALPSPEAKFISWCPVVGRFGDKDNFATLIRRDLHGTASVEELSASINEAYDRSIAWTLQVIATKGDAYMKQKQRCHDPEDAQLLDDVQQEIAKKFRTMAKSARPQLFQKWNDTIRNFSIPVRTLIFNADASGLENLTVRVNGRAIRPDAGKHVLKLVEGSNVICLSGKAKNACTPNLKYDDFQAGNNAWMYAHEAPENWQELTFDDREWKTYDGKLEAGNFYLRQTILWNQQYHGSLRCFNPPVHEWLFSQDSIDFLYFQMYSPVKRKVNSFRLILDLPQEMSLVETPTKSQHRINLPWEKVEKSTVTQQGLPYNRYIIHYRAADFDEWRTAESLIPVICSKNSQVGQTGNLFYSRVIDGNVVEITGKIPYRIIPPINGRRLQECIMSFYMGRMQPLAWEATEKMLQDTFASGFDTFFCGYQKNQYRDRVVEMGGKVTCGFLFHPYFGPTLKDGALFKLLDENKELYVTFFDNTKENRWDPKKHIQYNRQFLCPTLVTTTYKERYIKAVQDDYVNILFKDYPTMKYSFINWEYEPWAEFHTSPSSRKTAHCFCDLCKASFRKWAGLKDDLPLDNETILKQYYVKWRNFRNYQDGQVHIIIGDALADIGKEAIFYSGTHQRSYWKAAGEAKYKVFLGCPGNPPADRFWQKNMDSAMDFFRKNTRHRNIMGQRFIFQPSTYSWSINRENGWLTCNVLSHDGFIHPQTWKTQVIRTLASLHGGIDLQNPLEMVAGIRYYVGEATRMIAKYEKFFTEGTRQDDSVESADIAYPDVLVLTLNDERLVMLFNESPKEKEVRIVNRSLPERSRGFSFYDGKEIDAVRECKISIPAHDVAVIHIHQGKIE